VAKSKESGWGPCPACGGEVTGSVDAYLAHVQQVNDEHPDVEETDAGAAIVTPEEAPTGGVGVCSNCGQAVAAIGSEDAEYSESGALVQAPVESPEHMDAQSGTSEIVTHEVGPDPTESAPAEPASVEA
jgi:hypothetical protein